MSVLMSETNPEGWKLEELLDVLAKEVQAKSDKIAGTTSPIQRYITDNNYKVIKLLRTAQAVQEDTYEQLKAAKGPDRGPSNPRL